MVHRIEMSLSIMSSYCVADLVIVCVGIGADG